MSILRYLISIAVLSILLQSGTRAGAGDELASAHGKVTLDGRPLAAKKVIFHLKDGQFAGAKVKDDGTFRVDRLPVGTHKVTFEAKVKGMSIIPPKYSDETMSALRVEVKKGENRFDFDLKSR